MTYAIESRSALTSERQFKHTMRSARKRYKAERKSGTHHGLSFRAWARRTYNTPGCYGKLISVVKAKTGDHRDRF